jgi:uncharacterized protein
VRLDLHLFRIGGRRFAFAPVTDSLAVLDEPGWETLSAAATGDSPDEIRSLVARRHGPEVAARCLDELADLVTAHGLDRPDPLAGGPVPGAPVPGAPDPGASDPGAGWLPSSPENPVLKSLCLNVAHDCDLRCRYCFAGQGRFGSTRGLMTPEVARAAVDLLLANSGGTPTCEIDFFGGEPLLNLGVVRETVDYARRRAAEADRRVGFTLTTNAVALGPDERIYLDDTMDNVVLSLDGRPEVHDRMRPTAAGRPSQAAVLENIKGFVELREARARRAGDGLACDYWVRGTYTAANLDFTEDVIYLARQGLRNLSLEPVVGGPVGPGGWGLGPDHLPDLAAEYVRLADFILDEFTAGRPLRFFHFMAEPEAGPCYAKRVRGCGAGREYMAVTPNGDLYPCHQFVGREGFRLGNVTRGLDVARAARDGAGPGGSDGAALAAPDGSALGRRVGGLWLGAKPACRSCWARYRCSGGCHANGHGATGSLLEPDPLGCALLKTRTEVSLYLQARQTL